MRKFYKTSNPTFSHLIYVGSIDFMSTSCTAMSTIVSVYLRLPNNARVSCLIRTFGNCKSNRSLTIYMIPIMRITQQKEKPHQT